VFTQRQRQGFEHQRIAGRPQVSVLAILERDPGQQREAIVFRHEFILDLLHLARSAAV
jgi:hypothetical protein